MGKVRALLVGINSYTAVKPLHGCVADVTAIESLFRSRVAPEALDLRVLLDAQATRAAIIDGFRTHLAKAGSGDFALFYFCGHGSEEPCPPEWRHVESTGQNQTILSVDARTGDVFDIADKELSALIHDVAASGARVITMFDSCHSGEVTRGIGSQSDGARADTARMEPARTDRVRRVKDYLDRARELYDPARVAADGLPRPRHIAISACQHNQLAQEWPADPPRRGVFSLAIEEALRELGPLATYVDVVNAARVKVRARAAQGGVADAQQTPHLDVFGEGLDTEAFLGGQTGRRDLTVDWDEKSRSWWLSAGAVDGMLAPAESMTTVTIFTRGSFADSTTSPSALATATVVSVDVDRAELALAKGATLETAQHYAGTVTSSGTSPSLSVVVDPSAASTDAVARVRAALAVRGAQFLVTEKAGPGPTVTISVRDESIQLLGPGPAPELGVHLDFALNATGLNDLLGACTHLAKWFSIRHRRPVGSKFNDRVRIELVPVAPGESVIPEDRAPLDADSSGAVVLRYLDANTPGERRPLVKVRLRNLSDEELFVVLLDLGDSFDCSVQFAGAIPAGGIGDVNGGKVIPFEITGLRGSDVAVSADDLKVFAAVSDFDAGRFTMPSLLGRRTTRSVERDESAEDTEPLVFWGTSFLHVETRR